MRNEFELKSLESSLKKLLQEGVLKNEEQVEKLTELYKSDSRQFFEIRKEIENFRFDKNLLEEKLKENEKLLNVEINELNTKKEEKPLSLDNISDIEKDGKSYIKLHYPDGEIKMIENNTNPYMSGEEIFNEMKDQYKLISTDGNSNTFNLFEQVLLKKSIEIKVDDIKVIAKQHEFDKLSSEHKKIVLGTLKCLIASLDDRNNSQKEQLSNLPVEELLKVLNKEIHISLEENIVIISDVKQYTNDDVRTLKKEKNVLPDGQIKYEMKLEKLNTTSYVHNDEYEYDSNVETKETSENVLDEKTSDDMEKGIQKTYKKKKKKPNGQAAFINTMWSVLAIGVVVGILLMVLLEFVLS